ncbi:MAG: pectate lyase [Clostridium sp.]|nr:pectate lyase [Clostridium sp.]
MTGITKTTCYFVIFALLLAATLIFTLDERVLASQDMFELIGFATLNGGTTGGQGGITKYVSTGSEIESLLYDKKKGNINEPLTIYVQGTITPSNTKDSKIDVKEVEDVSIIGVGTKGEFDGIGIKIVKAKNVIIQNLKIHHVDTGDKDCISVEGPASNIWIDHCELYNDLDHGKDHYDGLFDAKKDSEYITFSWNRLHHSYKTSLIGSSDSDNFDRKITYHHNYISDCNSRLPAFRFGTGHIFNNYYANNLDTGINCRQGAKIKIENNYFENFKDPIGYWYSKEEGYWDVSNNLFINCTGNMPTVSTCKVDIPYNYSHVLHAPEQVKDIVSEYSGVGKIDGTKPTEPTSKPTPEPTKLPTPTPTQLPTPIPTIKINYGDINGDNKIDTMDLRLLKNYLLGSMDFSDEQFLCSDLNVDGSVDTSDLVLLKRYLLKRIDKLPYNVDYPSDPTPQPTQNPDAGDVIVHEAEADSNNFKYARVESDYVIFDQVKDAYVEMKKVGSPISGEVMLTFIYSNGTEDNLEMEIKVNSNTVESRKEFPSTGSWDTWGSLTVVTNMNSGFDNIIRFKSRTNDGGPLLDKVIIEAVK